MKNLFNNNNKKILIGSSLQEADTIIKSFVMKYKKSIANIEKATIISLATNLLQANEKYSQYKFLDGDEANALFYSFLKDNINDDKIFDLIPVESFSFATSKNAYDAICQIRNGKIKKENTKLEKMIISFEKLLNDKQSFDKPLILKYAINELKENIEKAILSLGYKNKVDFYLLPSLDKKLTYQEICFKEELEKAYNTLFSEISFDEENKNIIVRKIPTYGYSNVIEYIVNTIKEKQYNLNDVAIYKSTDAYDNIIKAYFDNYNINYLFANGESIVCEDFVAFLFSVLDFLANHFKIEHLYLLYKNPALAYYEDEDKSIHSYSLTSKLKYLKADKMQIIKQIEDYPQEKKQFILDLVNLYNENDKIGELYKNAFDFSLKYTNALSHRYCKDSLIQKERFFSLFDSINLSYREKVELIKSFIATLKIAKDVKEANESYILINPLSATYLPRKYNFFIGLSANEMTLNEIESPLVLDDEFKEIIDCDNYYVKLSKLNNEELINNLNKLINTQNDGEQYFITSIYDSVELKPLAKSSFYLNILENEENIYCKNNNIILKDANKVDIYLYPQTIENIKKANNTDLTPTLIETIMTCPLRYIYGLIYEDIQLDEFDGRWLKGVDEGNLTHKFLETYFNNPLSDSFDDLFFEKTFNDVLNEAKLNNPFSNEIIQDVEANKVKENIKSYLKRYYNENSLYKPIELEFNIQNIDNANYSYNNVFKIHGIIDRVDAYVDENKDLKIRIIDYKTYNKNSVTKHKANKLFPQAVVYPYLFNDYINNHIDEIKNKVGEFNIKDKYDITFTYELIKTKEKYDPIYDDVKEAVDYSLANYLKLIEKPTWDNFINLYQPITKQSKDGLNEEKCSYCSYKKYCRFKMQKGEQQVWSK